MGITNSRTIKDSLLGIGLLVISAISYWGTLDLPEPIFDPLGAAFVPRALSVCLAIMATLLLTKTLVLQARYRTIRKTTQKTASADAPEEAPFKPRTGLALFSVLLTTAYIASMSTDLLGYRTATMAFMVCLGTMLSGRKPKIIATTVLVAVVLALLIHWLFTSVLVVNLS